MSLTYSIDPIPFSTMINSNAPTTNYGTNIKLAVGYYGTAKTYIWRTYIEADISALIGETIEATSELRLYATSVLSGPEACHIYRVTQTACTEAGMTYNKYDGTNNWTTAGGDFTTPSVAFTYPAAAGDLIITGAELAAFLQDAIDSRSGIARMMLKLDTENGDRGGEFYSDDYTGSYYLLWRPELYVVYEGVAGGARSQTCLI